MSLLKLFNYLTRKKELFRPLRKGRVGLYTCGPTVYNYAHIGNLRTYIFEDVLRRTLEFEGWTVKQVMNLTDVDDKTIRGARAKGQTLKVFTEAYAKAFFRDIKKLGILSAWKYPRATAHIREMVGLISKLLKKKLAYRAPGGVYFDISKFRDYGRLSRTRARKLKAGVRIQADLYEKREAADFALWKAAKPGEPSWKANFSGGRPARSQRERGEARPGFSMPGRPGWHIECSAMSMKYLGPSFDIHAGGVDLLFPHHEDEIAQSEGATGKKFVRYFVEGEHLMVDGKKMSKSLGNIYTLADIEKRGFGPMDFRYFALGAHYRTPLNFTWKALASARQGRLGFINAMERINRGPYATAGHLKDENEALAVIAAAEKQFRAAMNDDLNTPKALAILNELLHYSNSMLDRRLLTARTAKLIRTAVLEFDRVLGLNLKKREVIKIPLVVAKLAERREELRRAGQWAAADKIRNQIKKLGYVIEDTPDGPLIRPRRHPER